jgi:hypothetical protein
VVVNTRRGIAWSWLILASIALLLIAVYKILWLSLGILAVGFGKFSWFNVANLVEGPLYLASAATAWKWPWVAESVAVFTLVVIFARFNPWTVSPFQRGLSLDYAFIIAANVAVIAKMSLRRTAGSMI